MYEQCVFLFSPIITLFWKWCRKTETYAACTMLLVLIGQGYQGFLKTNTGRVWGFNVIFGTKIWNNITIFFFGKMKILFKVPSLSQHLHFSGLCFPHLSLFSTVVSILYVSLCTHDFLSSAHSTSYLLGHTAPFTAPLQGCSFLTLYAFLVYSDDMLIPFSMGW